VFLETGDEESGLRHIMEAHSAEFTGKGISDHEVPDLLQTALTEGRIVGAQGRSGDRPIYECNYRGHTYRVGITVGNNGYIVGANLKW
jgi:filamentous hemagglutinin